MKDGGPAFPDVRRLQMLSNRHLAAPIKETIYEDSSGMSLRDYFAAKAMQAIAHESYRLGREFGYTQPDSLAEQAYKIADAMLAERSKSHVD